MFREAQMASRFREYQSHVFLARNDCQHFTLTLKCPAAASCCFVVMKIVGLHPYDVGPPRCKLVYKPINIY